MGRITSVVFPLLSLFKYIGDWLSHITFMYFHLRLLATYHSYHYLPIPVSYFSFRFPTLSLYV